MLGSTQATAASVVAGAGLTLGTLTQHDSATVPSGAVISETPTAGATVVKGSAVNLVVSTGPSVVTIPNVVGLTQDAATTAITQAGLLLGTVTSQPSSSVPALIVITQTPDTGSNAEIGSPVDLVVSSGAQNAGPPVNGLLPGPANALGLSAITDYILSVDFPPTQFETVASGGAVLRTEIAIIFDTAATIGQINSVLTSIGGQIVASNLGSPALVVEIPDPGSVTALTTIENAIASNSFVTGVVLSMEPGEDGLPPGGGYTDPPSIGALTDDAIDLAVGFDGVWGIAASLQHPAPVTFVILDYFGKGAPGNAIQGQLVVTDWSAQVTGSVKGHGYGVASVVLANLQTWQGAATVIPVRLRAVDLFSSGNAFKGFLSSASAALQIIRSEAASGRKVVFNTSLNNKDYKLYSDAQQAALAQFWALGVAATGRGSFLHVTSAGNQVPGVDPPLAPFANTNSAFTRAAQLGTDNIIVVGGTSLPASSADPVLTQPTPLYCPAAGAYLTGDVQGIFGPWSLWLGPSVGNVTGNYGTSFSTPQVGAVALLSWASNPTTSVANLKRQIIGTASPGTVCVPSLGTVDALAAVLAGDSTSENARLAMLDVAIPGPNGPVAGQDGIFSESDLAMLVSQIVSRAGQRDYSRYDLNGDGMTGGSGRAPFDLDNSFNGTRQSLFNSQLTVTIAGVTVKYDENNLTDSQIACYYAYSPLFKQTSTFDERPVILAPIASQCGLKLDHVNVTFDSIPSGWSVSAGATTLQSFSTRTSPAAFSVSGDPGCQEGGEQGTPVFSATVPTGAYLLPTNFVNNAPYVTAYPFTVTPCSSFIAVQGRQVWINATTAHLQFSTSLYNESESRLYSGVPDASGNFVGGYVDFGYTLFGQFQDQSKVLQAPMASVQFVYVAAP